MPNEREPHAPQHPGPIGGGMAAVLWGLARRLQLPSLQARHSQVGILGLFALVNGIISIALMAMAALVTGAPFIFPSLGPTAFLLFYTPTQPAASPRNTLGGHLIGALAGYLALVVFGLTERGAAMASGVDWANVGAAALSLGLTSGAMVWFKVPHPPAGATTLIVSLGILREPWQLAVLMLAVALLVVQGFVINRLAGIDYPVWAPRPGAVSGRAASQRNAAALSSRSPNDSPS
jgi:CBS-domain-containing membrane protein